MAKAIIPAALADLARSLDALPGIGPNAAARLSRKLIHDARLASELSAALAAAHAGIGLCEHCRSYTADDDCPVCDGNWIAGAVIQVVQLPEQIHDLKKAQTVESNWFVLHGLLSPIDAIGPPQLGLDRLQLKLQASPAPERMDVILEDSVEARTTAYYLETLAKRHGIPFRAQHIEGDLQPRG